MPQLQLDFTPEPPRRTRLFGAPLSYCSTGSTLLEVVADPKRLGAEIGFLCILHTWGQTLNRHPHIHCVVPGGGLFPDHTRWILLHPRLFLPVKVLSSVFRDKSVDGLKQAYLVNELRFYGDCQTLADSEVFGSFVDELSAQDLVVYAKPPFGGAEHVLQYLGSLRPTGHVIYGYNGKLMPVPVDLAQQKVTGEAVEVVAGVMMGPYSGWIQIAVSDTGDLAYVPGGMARYLDSFVLVDRKTGNRNFVDPRRRADESQMFVSPAVSPNGQQMATALIGANNDIYIQIS